MDDDANNDALLVLWAIFVAICAGVWVWGITQGYW